MASINDVYAEGGSMRLEFYLSGTCVFETDTDCVPPIGSEVYFKFRTTKKGITAGRLVAAEVLGDIPPIYDYTEGETVVVRLDVGEIRDLRIQPTSSE